jgi:NAD(P)-dependent dehydrogenase (short-subunit alcohol dehydrogenase family)
MKDRKIIITGGTKGIGKATTLEFLKQGAEVLFVARDKALISRQLTEYKESGFKVSGISADLSKESGINKLVKWVSKKWTSVDVLVNNVGFNIRKKTISYTSVEVNSLINTNLISAFNISVKLYPYLINSGNAAIINVSSVAGLTSLKTGSPYAITKAGLIQLTKNLAVEWAENNIRVNAVAPWYIKTPLTEKLLSDNSFLKSVLDRTPMKRYGNPEEVANVIVFLASDASSFVTGQCIAVDGGFSIYGF